MSGFRRVFRRPPSEPADARRAVDDELDFHLDEAEEELVAAGMSPGEARAEARRRFGDIESTRAYCVRQQSRRAARRGWIMRIGEVRQDLAYAWRTLRKTPGYSLVVMLTLAVGISASTVVFSLVNPYFLRPLPFGDPDELVQLGLVDPRYEWDGARFSLAMVEDYRTRASSLGEIGVYYYGFANVTGPEGPERVQVGYLSENMFGVLRADAARGRTFAPGEGGAAGADVVVVDWGLWQRRWAGDPSILGRSISLDGVAHTVVGIMPRDFNFPFGGVKLWTPLRTSAVAEDRGDAPYLPVARLAPGSSIGSARAELGRIHADLAARYPDADGVYTGVSVKPVREALNFAWDQLRMGLGTLLAAVFLVLAIACVNVAGLGLARAASRRREVAVRAAIGAGRGRIVRQLLTESLLLAAAGGALGVLVAYAVGGVLGPLLPEDLYRVGDITIDPGVLAFATGVTLATALTVGLAPALQSVRTGLAETLRAGDRGAGGGRALGTRRYLVAGEVALAVVLVTGTGLMIRSFAEIRRVDLGFDAERLLTVEVTPPSSDYPGPEEYGAYYDRAAEDIAALPGVTGVGQVYPLPMNHESIPRPFALPGSEPAETTEWPSALWASVTPGYFRTMGIALLEGRDFGPADVPGGPPSVIVSRTLAERHFPDGSPVGRSLLVASGDTPLTATVVGVVEDVVHSGFEGGPADSHLYRPQSQNPRRRRFLAIRTADDPRSVAGPVRRTLLELDPALPAAIRPMEDVVTENTYPWATGSLFLGTFGLVAVLLASLGVYGIVSYSVVQRRRELGVRMALGARAGEIRELVLGDGLRLSLVGGAVGILAALGLGRLIETLLFGVSPYDPWILGGVVVLFVVLALGASLLPALRATRVDPVRVLRAE